MDDTLTQEAMRHVEALCQIGARPIGSVGNRAAADYIGQTLAGLGLAVEEQQFDCALWEHYETRLELDGLLLDAVANAFSPPCDVAGPLVFAGTYAELAEAELEERIVVLYGELAAGGGFGARAGLATTEDDRRVLRLIEERRAAALLVVYPREGCVERMVRDWELGLPSATVPAEVGRALLRRPEHSARLRIGSIRAPWRFGNVVATQPEWGPARVLLCAHFDTAHDTPGAIDNASGVAALLATAAVLTRSDVPIGIEWVALNGEESGGLGAAAYLEQRGAALDEAVALVRIDGVGGLVSSTTLDLHGGSAALHERAGELRRRFPAVAAWQPHWPTTHRAWALRDVPSFVVSSIGVGNIQHFASDTLAWVGPTRLAEATSLTLALVEMLHDMAPSWARALGEVVG